MTQEEDVYIQTLNLFGSDFEPDWVQNVLDGEHRKADPDWICARKPDEAGWEPILNTGPQLP
jgi:hypothetical protein